MKTSTDLVRTWGIITALSFSSFGCAVSSGTASETPASPPQQPDKSPAVERPASPDASATKQEPKGPKLLYTLKDAGLAQPEAVIYDAEADVYFVSNVNGDPLAEDGNGFISKVGPDGTIQELKWIDGQSKGGTLNAPKGMAVSKGFLYVSDITWIRIFDRKTGEPKGKIFAKGATFLNGVTTNEEGEIAFSDTGWKSGKEGFSATGSDAVYRVDPKTVAAKELVRGKQLGNPNGLASTKEGLWVVNEQGELFLVGKDGKKEQTTKLAKGGLDGVVALDDGRFLVSSWKANAIYEGKPGGEFEVLLSDLKSPASIGFDTKRERILVPKMMEDEVLIYNLSGAAEAKASKQEKPVQAAQKQSGGKAEPAQGKAQGKKDEPKKVATLKTPAAPATPAQPGKAGEPAKPAQSASPSKPTSPTKPAAATPAEPGKPGQPAKPAQPASPSKPAAATAPAAAKK